MQHKISNWRTANGGFGVKHNWLIYLLVPDRRLSIGSKSARSDWFEQSGLVGLNGVDGLFSFFFFLLGKVMSIRGWN